MALTDCSTEDLEQRLLHLSQSFHLELSKISEKFERQPGKEDSASTDVTKRIAKLAAAVEKPSAWVHLEPSLGQRMADSSRKAHGLRDRLEGTRAAFEDRLRTADRLRADLNRREESLVRSIRRIEEHLRSLFCLKREADLMTMMMKDDDRSGDIASSGGLRKRTLLDAIDRFRHAKEFLEKAVVSDLPGYSSPSHLVQHFLVLCSLRNDLREDDLLSTTTTPGRLEATDMRILAVSSRENRILELQSRVKDLKERTARLEERVELTASSKVRDDSAWHDVQRWIRNLHESAIQIRPPDTSRRPSGSVVTTDMLDELKDFVTDTGRMVEMLKME